jgi:monofunctional glycosyltransferase
MPLISRAKLAKVRKARRGRRAPRRPIKAPAPRATARAAVARRWPLRRIVLVVTAILLLGPPLWVAAYRVAPPPVTLLMLQRAAAGQGLHKRWRGLSDISPDLPRAVIAGEDARFCRHHGFDLAAMHAAAAHNARDPGKVRGGSTISQQTAKNVFLWPQRSYLRKALEAYYTVLIEALWGKRRILEVYLNVVEWGPGVYGAEAAAERYFHHDAADITPSEASRLAAILPDPLKWKAVRPGRYVARRSRRISAGAQAVEAQDLAACVLRGG